MREDEENPLRCRALKMARAAADWKQGDLAAAARINASTLSDYERGDKEPSLATLYRLTDCMGLTRDWVDELLALLEKNEPREGEPPSAVEQRIEEYAHAARPLAEGYLRKVLTRFVAEILEKIERRRDAELWERLALYDADQRIALVELGAKFRRVGLCLRACEESKKAAADDADRALGLARLAVRIAELAPVESAADSLRLRGQAGFFLGNALRVKGDLPPADEAFARARQLWEEGTDSTIDLSEGPLLELEASLRREQRRLEKALDLLDRALEFDRSGERRGRILLKRAKTLEEMDDYESAIQTLNRAAPLIEALQEPRLLLVLRFNLLFDLTHVSRHAEAEKGLAEVQALATQIGNALDRVRLSWLRGRIAAGLGRTGEAITLLSRARGGFASSGILYDTALVTLELAVLHVEEGQTAQVKALARQTAPIFRNQDVPREALAAFMLFQRAAEEERVTVALARRFHSYFLRAQQDPKLHFEG
jgi:transcriptional regulator with XRE-family HTH domain